jgi:cyanophycin synthetase
MRIGTFDLGWAGDIEELDRRLEELLGHGWDGPGEPPFPNSPPKGARGVGWVLAGRVLEVAASLMRSAKMPAFSAGQVVDVQRTPGGVSDGRWVFNVMVPWIDNVPEAIHQAAYYHAVLILRWCCSREPTSSLGQMQERVHREWVLPTTDSLREGGSAGLVMAFAAFCTDIPFRHLGSGLYHLGMGSKSTLTLRGGSAGDAAIGVRLTDSKIATVRFLRQFGLPVSQPELVDSEASSLEVARAMGWPVVIKPDDCERGEGVTTGIDSETRLREAFRAARALSTQVLLEKEVAGTCHRILVVRGQLITAIRRDPPRVVGDGKHSIQQLVAMQRAADLRLPRWSRGKTPPEGAELAAWLRAATGGTPDDVPESGQPIPLRPRESWAWGGYSEAVTARIHPDNVELAVRAASALKLEIAGVDLMTHDIALPWYESGATIIEVNFSPSVSLNMADHCGLAKLAAALLPNGGRIPVDVVVGRARALARGKALQAERTLAGERCYLAASDTTLRPDGSVLRTLATPLYKRVQSLILDNAVDSLVIVADDPAWLETGLPVNRIDRLVAVDVELDAGLRRLRDLAVAFRSDAG